MGLHRADIAALGDLAKSKEQARRVLKATAFRHFDRGHSTALTADLMNLNRGRVGQWRREWNEKRGAK